MSRKISEEVREIVRRRAGFLCEYCHTNERWQYVRFTIDHIFPNEDDSPENLALACFHCNRRKLNKTSVRNKKTKRKFRYSIREPISGKIILRGRMTESR